MTVLEFMMPVPVEIVSLEFMMPVPVETIPFTLLIHPVRGELVEP
jgi:hypothetical protein